MLKSIVRTPVQKRRPIMAAPCFGKHHDIGAVKEILIEKGQRIETFGARPPRYSSHAPMHIPFHNCQCSHARFAYPRTLLVEKLDTDALGE